jgi:hypothetical protein
MTQFFLGTMTNQDQTVGCKSYMVSTQTQNALIEHAKGAKSSRQQRIAPHKK